jgi:hypothetical protein
MAGSDLGIFIGQWEVRAHLSGETVVARSVFEWILDGRYLAQRTEAPVPEAPNTLAIVAAGPEEGTYTQHYYDSRGMTRVYAMTFTGGVWTLTREAADFSSLDFAQRFTGTFSADGDRIDGAWEMALPGSGWELDFELSYTRIS